MENGLTVIETVKSVSDFATKMLDSYHNKHTWRAEEKRAFQIKLKTAVSMIRMQAQSSMYGEMLNQMSIAWDKLQRLPKDTPLYDMAVKQFEILVNRLSAETQRFTDEISLI